MTAFLADLLARFDADPVVSLDRRDPPTHLVVRSVHAGAAGAAYVAFDLIDTPPPPSKVEYGGATLSSDFPPERAWWRFEPALGFDENLARMRDYVRDAIALSGRSPRPPRAAVEPPALGKSERSKSLFESARRAPPPPEPPPPPTFEPFAAPPSSRPEAIASSSDEGRARELRPSAPPSRPLPPPPPARDSSTGAPTQKLPRASRVPPPPEPPPPPEVEAAAPRAERSGERPRPRSVPPPSDPARSSAPPLPPAYRPAFDRPSGPPEPPPPRPLFGEDDS